jgi:hypothetical protein
MQMMNGTMPIWILKVVMVLDSAGESFAFLKIDRKNHSSIF